MSKLVTYHPTFAFFHAPHEAGTFEVDIHRFSRLIKGTLRAPPRELRIISTAKQFRRWLAEHGKHPIAVDIETAPAHPAAPWTGKDPTQARLRTIGFGTQMSGISMWWATAGAKLQGAVRDFLTDEKFLKIFHNGQWFDLRVLRRNLLTVKRWRDTRDMRRAISSTSRLSLRYLASIYDDTNNWKDDDEDDGKGLVFTDKRDKLMKYNAQDCVETARVYAGLKGEPEWREARTRKLYDVHQQLSVIAAKMHSRGIYVNRQERAFMTYCVEQAIIERAAALRALVGSETFPCTDHSMRALIYERHKRDGIRCFMVPDPFNPKMYTSDTKETISVDEPSLIMLLVSGECPPELVPIIDAFWALQKEKKRLGYLKSLLIDHAMGHDNRLRPGWNSCGTETMRFSCSEPNVMNIEQMLRAFLGPAPGKVIIHADKRQLELRVMEPIANDRMLKAAIDTGDVYSFDAKDWFQLPNPIEEIPDRCKAQRKASKIIHLGRQYGAGLKTVFTQALLQDRRFTFERTTTLIKKWDATYSDTVHYWQTEMERVMACGYSEGRLLGGRRTYPQRPELSEVVNFPVQRTAGEMMNLEMIELDRRLSREVPAAGLVIQLHDAFDVEADERDEEKVTRIVSEVMDREWTIDGRTRHFPVEIKVTRHREGGTWADV